MPPRRHDQHSARLREIVPAIGALPRDKPAGAAAQRCGVRGDGCDLADGLAVHGHGLGRRTAAELHDMLPRLALPVELAARRLDNQVNRARLRTAERGLGCGVRRVRRILVLAA